jgi:hypothetical protein
VREVRDERGKLAGAMAGERAEDRAWLWQARSRSATMRRPPRCTKREPFLESPPSLDSTSQVFEIRRFRGTREIRRSRFDFSRSSQFVDLEEPAKYEEEGQ